MKSYLSNAVVVSIFIYSRETEPNLRLSEPARKYSLEKKTTWRTTIIKAMGIVI